MEHGCLNAAPVDLHNARLVVLYGALHGVVWQADVKSAYLQAPLGGNATWLRLPASLLDKLPPSARDMKDPAVLKLNRALYGHPRAGVQGLIGMPISIIIEQCRVAYGTKRKELMEVSGFCMYAWYLY